MAVDAQRLQAVKPAELTTNLAAHQLHVTGMEVAVVMEEVCVRLRLSPQHPKCVAVIPEVGVYLTMEITMRVMTRYVAVWMHQGIWQSMRLTHKHGLIIPPIQAAHPAGTFGMAVVM
jgi:hypothetical protein